MSALPSRLYAYLKALAEAGETCPRNADIAATLRATEHTISRAFRHLSKANRVSAERVGNRRIIRLLGTPLMTADPRPVEIITIRPPVRDIIAAAAEAFFTTPRDIASRSRYRPHVLARKAVCATAWGRGWKSTQIARAIGGRDHSTVLHHRDTAPLLASVDADFAGRLALVEARTPQPFERVI